jgi:hypothetical protein
MFVVLQNFFSRATKMMNNAAMEDVEGRFGRPEVMMASSNLMQKVRHAKLNFKNCFRCLFELFTV